MGNVPRSHSTFEAKEKFTRALMTSERGGSFADHAVWWKTQNGKLIFSAVPYLSEKDIFSTFNDIAHNFDFSASIKIKILPDKYHWRHDENVNPPHYIIYDERAMEL